MQELAEYSAWGSSSKPTLNQKRSPFLRDAVIVYWWSKSGDNPRREKQTKKTHEVQFKASKHWGKKIKSTFHSVLVYFLIHRLGERKETKSFVFIVSISLPFEQSRCTFTTVSCDAVIPNQSISREDQRLLHTRWVLFFAQIPDIDFQFDLLIERQGWSGAGFWVTFDSGGAAPTSKEVETVASTHWNQWLYISIRHGFLQYFLR